MHRNTATWFTLGNVASGLLSAVFFRKRKPRLAVGAIILAGVLDVLDGWAARKSGQSGKRGSLLDASADMVSFGLVPGFLLLQVSKSKLVHWIAVLYSSAMAFRLIRFTKRKGEPGVFVGIPSPAAAIAVVGACTAAMQHKWLTFLAPFSAIAFGGLGVSKLPYGKISHPSLGLLTRAKTIFIYAGHILFFFIQPGLAALSLMTTYAFLGPGLMKKFHCSQQGDSTSGVPEHESDR